MENRKKVLHIITGLELGGAERNLAKIVPVLEKNFDNQVCCLTGKGKRLVIEEFEKANIPIHYFNIQGLFGFINPKTIFKFRKIIKEFNPDILETYLIHADLFGRVWGKIFGIKKIICNHRGSLLQWEWLSHFDALTSFLVTKYVFQTPSAQKEISKKIKINIEKTIVIPNVIDLKKIEEFKIDKNSKLNELGVKDKNNLNIVFVSNLREGKGCKYLVEAFEKVFEEGHKNINLIIGGDGDQKETIENKISRCRSRNNIYFPGERVDSFEFIKIGDIFVLPTFYEGMSNVIMEAMAFKLPIITTNIDVNKDLITDKKTGILVPVADSTSIADNLIKLIENPQERERLGQNAFEDIKNNYSIKVVASKISSLLNSL